jgi:hypothetical protein
MGKLLLKLENILAHNEAFVAEGVNRGSLHLLIKHLAPKRNNSFFNTHRNQQLH